MKRPACRGIELVLAAPEVGRVGHVRVGVLAHGEDLLPAHDEGGRPGGSRVLEGVARSPLRGVGADAEGVVHLLGLDQGERHEHPLASGLARELHVGAVDVRRRADAPRPRRCRSASRRTDAIPIRRRSRRCAAGSMPARRRACRAASTDMVIVSWSGAGTDFSRSISPFLYEGASAPQTLAISSTLIRCRGTYAPYPTMPTSILRTPCGAGAPRLVVQGNSREFGGLRGVQVNPMDNGCAVRRRRPRRDGPAVRIAPAARRAPPRPERHVRAA